MHYSVQDRKRPIQQDRACRAPSPVLAPYFRKNDENVCPGSLPTERFRAVIEATQDTILNFSRDFPSRVPSIPSRDSDVYHHVHERSDVQKQPSPVSKRIAHRYQWGAPPREFGVSRQYANICSCYVCEHCCIGEESLCGDDRCTDDAAVVSFTACDVFRAAWGLLAGQVL